MLWIYRNGIVVGLSICAVTGLAAIKNGSFENSQHNLASDWQASGPGVKFRPASEAAWQHRELVVDTGDFDRIRLFFGIQGEQGTVWIDNVSVKESEFSPSVVDNFSFESGEGSELTGWKVEGSGKNSGDVVERDSSEWTRYPGQDFGKGASARLVGAEGGQSRIYQDVAILGRRYPEKRIVVGFDWRSSGIAGDVFVKVRGILADGKLSDPLRQRLVASPSILGGDARNVAELSLTTPGTSRIAQQLSIPTEQIGRPICATALVRATKLVNGAVSLRLRSGAAEEGETSAIGEQADEWKNLSLRFVPNDPKVTLEVEVAGDAAVVLVDDVRVEPATIDPEPAELQWGKVSDSFVIPETLSVNVGADLATNLQPSIQRFETTLHDLTGARIVVEASAGQSAGELRLLLEPDNKEILPEGYHLSVDRRGILLVARDAQGIRYGLTSLLELIYREPDGRHLFLAAELRDYPDLPFRGLHMGSSGLSQSLLDQLARLRINAIAFQSSDFFHLDDEATRQKVVDLFRRCREMGIEPIPQICCLGWAGCWLQIDPNLAEGTEVVDERHAFEGVDTIELAHPNVIRTESTNIRVRSNDSDLTYGEGVDYEVLPGQMQYARRAEHDGYSSVANRFRLRRLPAGSIPEGGTVLVNYDYVSRVDQGDCSSCPNEPRVYELMEEKMRQIVDVLQPKYLHIGHDESLQMGTDSRCRHSGRSNAENFAMEVNRARSIARSLDPNLKLMMWDDMVNPYSHGFFENSVRKQNAETTFRDSKQLIQDPTAAAIDLLPKDIVLNVWFYESNGPANAGATSLSYFGKKGFQTTASPYVDRQAIYGWAAVCKQTRDEGIPCLGLLFTTWSNAWPDLEEAANVAWRTPRM